MQLLNFLDLYIGDSSNKNETKKNKKIIKKIKKILNIKYFEYLLMGTGHVCYYLFKQVKTHFASYLADDDFIITSKKDLN